jgi:isoaspartyl peptidase/L-asparaginase-like protein (Ntn-hydrolase superfamily)
VRKDVPDGPTAEVVVKPAASFVHAIEHFAIRDAGRDVELVLDAGAPPEGSFALVFGGLESAPERPQTERKAVQVALAALASGKAPVDAAVDAVAVLEDDPDRNAGRGSSLRIDGVTVQMDAAVMAEDGRFGAVAAISRVRHPVRVARAVFDTEQRVLTGSGAQVFARGLGHWDFDPVTEQAKASYRTLLAAELARDAGASSILPQGWQMWVDASALLPDAGAPAEIADASLDAGAAMLPAAAADAAQPKQPPKPVPAPPKPAVPKAPKPLPPLKQPQPKDAGHDTVAALVRSEAGGFAGAVSSGGPPLTVPGRVGDVPTPGAALWVGKRGAVAITGPGERIIDLGLARAVYEKLVVLRSPKLAAAWGAKQLPADVAVCIAVMDGRSFAVEPADAMAWVASEGDKSVESATGKTP